ncbi:hypothetical protein [Burkholderia cepacia]|uniref:hypothetical protein n=1 Tax=Burkholderia cepacia TaxID=292 RepID=UPI00249EC58F|nr:hypothetical protein [Burkholderia cepacia]
MIVSAPTQGGQHLADVIAGIVFGVLAIVVVRRAMARPRMAAIAAPHATHPTCSDRAAHRSSPLSSALSPRFPRC